MRAVALDSYVDPQELTVREVDEPKLGPDTVLVRTAASCLPLAGLMAGVPGKVVLTGEGARG